jgi:phenylacetate-CoA ligase
LKIFLNAATGRPPRQRDLDEIVVTLRRRLMVGKPMRPPAGPKLSPAFLQRRLRAFQLRKLRHTVDHVGRHIPFYQQQLRAVGIQAADFRSLSDVQKLPLLRREELQTRQIEFISRAPYLAPSLHMSSSGTTGQTIDAYLTPEEFDRYTSTQAIAGMNYGFLGPQHISQIHLQFDNSISSKIYNVAAYKSGTLLLTPGINGSMDAHLDSLLQRRNVPGKFPQVSVLSGAPGFLWAMAERSLARGLRPQDFGLKRVFASGAKVSAALKERVKAAWGVRLFEGYSLIEAASTGAYECDHGRLHFLDFSGLLEVLDPQTLQPVKPGQVGVGVITAFYPDRELMPLLRYWTSDLMQMPVNELCPCGLVSTSIVEITGREDHVIIIGGMNVYPQPVGDALLAFPELIRPPKFQMRLEERSGAQTVVIEAELVAPLSETAGRQLEQKILSSTPVLQTTHAAAGIVKVEVQLVPAGSIAKPFPYKLQGPTPV